MVPLTTPIPAPPSSSPAPPPLRTSLRPRSAPSRRPCSHPFGAIRASRSCSPTSFPPATAPGASPCPRSLACVRRAFVQLIVAFSSDPAVFLIDVGDPPLTFIRICVSPGDMTSPDPARAFVSAASGSSPSSYAPPARPDGYRASSPFHHWGDLAYKLEDEAYRIE